MTRALAGAESREPPLTHMTSRCLSARGHLAVATPVTPGSLEAPIAALPVLPNPLIGRERELATAQALLREPAVRLLTLSGPGGVGKTRLAVEVARSLAAEFSDGINFVPLAGVSDSDSVAPAIAWAMGFREVGDRPATAHLADELPHRNALLVLDNFEQVDAAAPLLAMLLGAGSGLKLMVTSRSPLHLAAEHLFPIPPLAFPIRIACLAYRNSPKYRPWRYLLSGLGLPLGISLSALRTLWPSLLSAVVSMAFRSPLS